MKKLVVVLLAIALVFSLVGCGGAVMKAEGAQIDGIFVDESYVSKDNAALKRVYLFVTMTASETNRQISSQSIDMVIGENVYDSSFVKRSCKFMPSYYHSSFIEDVPVGSEFKVAFVFEIPEGDLVSGKTATVQYDALSSKTFKIPTEQIVRCENAQKIGEIVDPEGCAEEVYKSELADAATVQKVKNSVNGYYFTYYVSLGETVQKEELEFIAPNRFELRGAFGLSNVGTYEVQNGYIGLKYDNATEVTIQVPYEFKDGNISLDCSTAFSIYE